MGPFSDHFHKSLLPLGNQAIISRIIAQFGKEHEYVIPVGYLSNQLIDFFSVVHPDLKVQFVTINNYEGKGSGPGLSLYECRSYLQEPFILTASDTLVNTTIPMNSATNWLGVKRVNDSENWCSVTVKDEQVIDIFYKEKQPNARAFIGLGFIKNYAVFWKALSNNSDLLDNELQVNNGLKGLIPSTIKTIEMDWIDTGTYNHYKKALPLFNKNYTFQGKITDITYKYNQSIIKLFNDSHISIQRAKRAKDYPTIFSKVEASKGTVYRYKYTIGTPLSELLNYCTCMDFLSWAETHLWEPKKPQHSSWKKTNQLFYKDKSIQRLTLYKQKYDPLIETSSILINSLQCLPIETIIHKIPDSFFEEGLASTYHGDLHSDNIIKTEKSFVLIDWRESFGDSTDIGDRYYDLAKFLHTLYFSVAAMEKGLYSIKQINEQNYTIDHQLAFNQIESITAFWESCNQQRYNKRRIELINALIFVNMAPLYSKKLATYLYLLGRYKLNRYFLEREY